MASLKMRGDIAYGAAAGATRRRIVIVLWRVACMAPAIDDM